MIKASLYAANAISDGWLVNLVERQIEVYREPVSDASQRYGWRYGRVTVYRSGEVIAPLAKPDAQVAVGNVLP